MTSATWEEASVSVRAALDKYFRDRGQDAASATSRSTIETNTTLVPKRAGNLLRALEGLAGVGSLEGQQVVEAGCGFGALAAYLAVAARPARLRALDIRPDYVAIAKDIFAPLELGDRLQVAVDDMRRFEQIPDASADLVILNNAFIYLPTRDDMNASLVALHRITRPGGRVLFYQANRWTLREPFTKDPLVHLLPARLAPPVASITGWRHNHGRVRLISPPGLRRMLERRGFEVDGYGAFVRDRGFVRGRAAWGAGFFALCGRRR